MNLYYKESTNCRIGSPVRKLYFTDKRGYIQNVFYKNNPHYCAYGSIYNSTIPISELRMYKNHDNIYLNGKKVDITYDDYLIFMEKYEFIL